MKMTLAKNLLDFIENEKTSIKLREISDSEFWLEESAGFLTARFYVDIVAHEVLYDIFSPKYDFHLKEESLRDIEKLERIVEEKGKWDYDKPIEELWMILDRARLWSQNNGFSIKEKHII